MSGDPAPFSQGPWPRPPDRTRWGLLAAIGALSALATLPLALSPARGSTRLTVHHTPSVLADALESPIRVATLSDNGSEVAALAVDGREDTAWKGTGDRGPWRWSTVFANPVHLGLLRARFGESPVSGIPREFRWEALVPATANSCPAPAAVAEGNWAPIDAAAQASWQAGLGVAGTQRRSWFVDADACGLRLVVERTNAGPPVLREVHAFRSARDVLVGGVASDEGAWPGFPAAGAFDGKYGSRWAGEPGASGWVLRVDLPEPQPIDRLRLVLGFDAASVPRVGGAGRDYAIAWAPLHYRLEVSENGKDFVPVASEPLRPDGSVLPVRRRLVVLAPVRPVRAVRLVISDATGGNGLPEVGAVPVVRELAAYRADDTAPVLAAPWILSVNANVSAQTHAMPGGEWGSDVDRARFVHGRFAKLLPVLRRDDRFARMRGLRGELVASAPRDADGEALESIEGDDPILDERFLSQSDPPPIVVLGGSNEWEYGAETRRDARAPQRWTWNPLATGAYGGMGGLAAAVHNRVAPFLGFCGGAQILALLESKARSEPSLGGSQALIDRVLSRATGAPIRGFAAPSDFERAWFGDPLASRAEIRFLPDDPLFADLGGPDKRAVTRSLPEQHADAVRPEAFAPGQPLDRFKVVATSEFCQPEGSASPSSAAESTPPRSCHLVPQAFRSTNPGWPVIGTQFHPEQHEFSSAGVGDPSSATADPRLFTAGVYELIVDAFERYGS